MVTKLYCPAWAVGGPPRPRPKITPPTQSAVPRHIDDLSMIFSLIGCTGNQGTKGPVARRACLFRTVALCLLTLKPAATAVIRSTHLSLITDLGFTAVTPSDDLTDLEAPAAMVCPQETAAALLVWRITEPTARRLCEPDELPKFGRYRVVEIDGCRCEIQAASRYQTWFLVSQTLDNEVRYRRTSA
jgi:hypothetical protein